MRNRNKNTVSAAAGRKNNTHLIGGGMNFAASEAYKLLRTNLMFSFSETDRCNIIGMTSAFRGEGKSLTSINLAYTFAEAKKRVLLMCLPNVEATYSSTSGMLLCNVFTMSCFTFFRY